MGYERMETLHNVVQLSPYSFSHLIFSSSQFMGQNTICVAADIAIQASLHPPPTALRDLTPAAYP